MGISLDYLKEWNIIIVWNLNQITLAVERAWNSGSKDLKSEFYWKNPFEFLKKPLDFVYSSILAGQTEFPLFK